MGIVMRSAPAGSARSWQARLRHALAEELFVLHFQPIVSVADGELSHHEALLRLADRADGDLVAPALFLGAAERSGLIEEIDLMVLEKALELLALHGDSDSDSDGDGLGDADGAPTPALAVNLSAVTVSDPWLLARLEGALERHGAQPQRLVLELTETAAISDMAAARHFCEGALALGCRIALDDFGSGYGSLQYLKLLPFSQLKIDGLFIRRLAQSHTDQLVVEALVGLARGMGRETVAECVGDEPTLELLRDFGVDFAQGYHVGRPGPLPALAC